MLFSNIHSGDTVNTRDGLSTTPNMTSTTIKCFDGYLDNGYNYSKASDIMRFYGIKLTTEV